MIAKTLYGLRSFYFSLFPEVALWFLLLIWLLGIPPTIMKLITNTAAHYLSSGVYDFIYPILTYVLSISVAYALSPRWRGSVVWLISAVFILYSFAEIARFYSVVNIEIHAILVFLFLYSVKSKNMVWGSCAGSSLALLYIVLYLKTARPWARAGRESAT